MSTATYGPIVERISASTPLMPRTADNPPASTSDPRCLGIYLSAVQGLVNYLYHHQWTTTGQVLGAFLAEPWEALKSGGFYVFGESNDFNYYHLNPKAISLAQSRLRPILLIHGDHDNQSIWLSLARRINDLALNLLGPVFTVNLPSGQVTQSDYDLINAKLNRIRELYRVYGIELNQFNVVGHSRGSEIISTLLARPEQIQLRIYKAILLGAVVTRDDYMQSRQNMADFENRVLEINGRYDVLQENLTSSLPQVQRLELNEGHLGVPFSELAHERILQFLRA